MPKNVKTTVQLHSFHMLVRLCSKSFKLGFSSMWTKMFKLDFKAEEPDIKLPTFIGSWRKKGLQKNIYLGFTDYAKAFDCVDHNKLWKSLKRWEYQTTSPVSRESCMWFKKQQLEPDIEQLTGSKLGKEADKAVYCLPTYLTYMQSVCESCSVVSSSLRPHGLYSPWNSLGQNTGVGSLSLLQGIFPTQGSNPDLLHFRWIL